MGGGNRGEAREGQETHDERVDRDHDDDDEEGVGYAWEGGNDHHDDPIERLDALEEPKDTERTQAAEELERPHKLYTSDAGGERWVSCG